MTRNFWRTFCQEGWPRLRVCAVGIVATGLVACGSGSEQGPAGSGDVEDPRTTASSTPEVRGDKSDILKEIYGENARLHLLELYGGKGGERFASKHLGAEIEVGPGVFMPHEAELVVLPFMKARPGQFKDKVVMEIGTGSGIVALYAAKLGASKVIATDISSAAIASVKANAQSLGFESVIDARLVPLEDTSAYSVLAPGEQIDTLISNPPFAIDLDNAVATAQSESGDLGFSLLQGLRERLRPGGRALLYYGSDFFHLVMVKYARHLGYRVRFARPTMVVPWEVESLYDYVLREMLRREGVAPDAFDFDWREDRLAVDVPPRVRPAGKLIPGWMVILP